MEADSAGLVFEPRQTHLFEEVPLCWNHIMNMNLKVTRFVHLAETVSKRDLAQGLVLYVSWVVELQAVNPKQL